MQDINYLLYRLSKSKFRSSFHLKKQDLDYINKKGLETIKSHAYDFINQRLKPSFIPNDGKQTPMRGHPVFKAQHATACCCRKCLKKWYNVPENKYLTELQQEKIVNLIMAWIQKQINY